MSRQTLEHAIHPRDRVLLDASTLIAYLNGGEAVSPVSTFIINEWVRGGRNEAVISMVSVMELLVKPLRQVARGPYQTAVDFLTSFPHMHALPITVYVAQEAASIRATYGFSAPDSLTIATGIVAQVGHLITNDQRWKKLQPITERIRVCSLADHLPFP